MPKSNRWILLLILLLITLIAAIIYHKSITLIDISNWYVAVRDFVNASEDFKFWATIFTITGIGVFLGDFQNHQYGFQVALF